MRQLIYLARQITAVEAQYLADTFSSETICYTENEAWLPENLPYAVRIAPPFNGATLAKKWQNDVVQFAYAPTVDGKKVIDYCSFGGANHWHCLRLSVYFRYRTSAIAANRFFAAIAEAKPMRAQLYHYDTALPAFVQHQCSCEVEVLLGKSPHPTTKTPRIYYAHYFLIFALRTLIGLLQLPFLLLLGRWRNIIFADPELLIPSIDPDNPQHTKLLDPYFGYWFEALQDKPDFLLMSELQPPKMVEGRSKPVSLRYILPQYPKKMFFFEPFMALSLLNPFFYYRLRQFRKQLAQFALSPAASPDAQAVAAVFPTAYKIMYLSLLRRYAAQCFFGIVPVRTVGGTNEHTVTYKPLLDVARQYGVSTFGIQHGMVSFYHTMYCSEDIAYEQLPDKNIFWGEFWVEQLPKDSVYTPLGNTVVLGQLRTQIIPKLKKMQKTDVSPILDNHRPLLVYLSQPLFADDVPLRERLTRDFFRLTAQFPDCQFVIKPHNLETDWEAFHKIAREVCTENYTILKEDLYKILSVGDIVLTYNSTAGVETVYFNKPLLIANYRHDDVAQYIKNGVGWGFDSYEMLAQKFDQWLKGNLLIDVQVQDQYTSARAYGIDGKTVARYTEFVRQLAGT